MKKPNKLNQSYYCQDDTLFLSRDLIGKHLMTNFDGHLTGGMITETEGFVTACKKLIIY